MLYGRTMPRANRGATISVACLLLLALLLLLPPLWQPGSTVGSNCGCGLAWLRVFGDDARAIQRARTRLDALGWRGRGTAWQSTGSTADRDPGSAARNASTRRTDSTRAPLRCPYQHRTPMPTQAPFPDA
jgi:hypothetical protein